MYMKDNVDFAATIVKELSTIIEDRVNKAIDKKFTDKNGNKLDVMAFIHEQVLKLVHDNIGITEKGKLNPEFVKFIKEEVAHILAKEGLEELDEEDEESACNSCGKPLCNECDCDEEFVVNEEDESNCNECDAYEEGYNDGYQTGYDVGYKAGSNNKKDQYANGYIDGIHEGVYRVVTALNDWFKENGIKHRITITNDNNHLNIFYKSLNGNISINDFNIPLQNSNKNPRTKEKFDKEDKTADELSKFYNILKKILNE